MTQRPSPDPQYESGFTAWKDFGPTYAALIAASSAAGTAIVYSQSAVALGTASSAFGARYMDPSDFTSPGRTTQVRMRISYYVGGVGPGTTITWNFCSVATWNTAGSNVRAGVASVNAALVTTNVASPAANTQSHLETAAGNFTTAGYWCVTCVLSGTTAANSAVDWGGQLQYRYIQP